MIEQIGSGIRGIIGILGILGVRNGAEIALLHRRVRMGDDGAESKEIYVFAADWTRGGESLGMIAGVWREKTV